MVFSPQGSLITSTYFGGPGPDQPQGIALADGIVYLAGVLSTPAITTTAPYMTPAIENAASYFEGPIAPGEIVTIRAFGIGPETGVASEPDANGRSATELAGTQILIDGIAAPVLYAQSRQVNATVPFEVAGKTSAPVHTVYKSSSSNSAQIAIAEASDTK